MKHEKPKVPESLTVKAQVAELSASYEIVLGVDRPIELEPAHLFLMDPAVWVRRRRRLTKDSAVRRTLPPLQVSTGPLWTLTVAELSDRIGRRELSAEEITRAFLNRISAVEPSVKAWVTLVPEKALAEARRADHEMAKGRRRGPLHGIPMAVKDIIMTRGIRTTACSLDRDDFVPTYDATVVVRLKRAGAVLMGKTTTTEYACGEPPVTCNPWNLNHTPGGSSSGSAAGVAAGMVPFSIGSQTASSLLNPAHNCGVVSIKPTYGLVSRHGMFTVSWAVDHPGPITRTAHDAALVLEAIAGRDPFDLSTRFARRRRFVAALDGVMQGARIGRPDRYFQTVALPEVSQICEAALHTMINHGAGVMDISLPPAFEAANAARQIISVAESGAYHRDRLLARPEQFGDRIRARLEAAASITADAYLQSTRVRRLFVDQLWSLFEQVDLLAMPTAPTPAPVGLEMTGDQRFCSIFSFAGFPSLTVPAGFTAGGLPIGLQLVAVPGNEEELLRVADAYQRVTDWHTLTPDFAGVDMSTSK